MAVEQQRSLKVFLCHASGDKPAVRTLYQRLVRDGVDAWLDRERLLPGQDWQMEIPKAVREADVVVVCLSKKSTTKEGYIQKELKFALDSASEKPEGTIFLIPARLEECEVPARLGSWQWVDLFEVDGYERLMRSLRLRAEKLGMHVGENSFTDRELGQRLDQLYTEGLAALWVEDWDKACHRFETILGEKPDHLQAAAKLEEAKRQRYLNDLYLQALDAQQSEDWVAAIEILQKLTSEVSDYKDASLMLKSARKKSKLSELYDEARRLYKAEQWQATLKVFAQIAALEPNYQDPDGLLPSAEKEVAELKRLAQLNELYSRGVREMDGGNWQEARQLLEQVHKSQTGFLETERLLRKVENELIRIEELNQRNIQVNTLYEQAHELIRSKNWRKALDKIEEIQGLDNRFVDRDGIVEKARGELDREEEIIQRQNELAAMYTEAVRLLKESKYQEALDKWQEVRAMDPKYPDRQGVQKTARKQLARRSKPVTGRARFTISTPVWLGMGGIVIVAILIFGIYTSNDGNAMLPGPTSIPSLTSGPVGQPVLIPKFSLRINYGHDWVESFYEAGHKVVITVTDGKGVEKATATVFTGPRAQWGGETGFQTTPEDWSPERPDLQPYDWVSASVDNGASVQVQLGDIHGKVDSSLDRITGTLDVPWITDQVIVECIDWGSGEFRDAKNAGLVLTDGSAQYSCSWEGEWDVQPWQDIGTGYSTPDGHWVANAFRDERWLTAFTYDLEPGFWPEGEHSYYFKWVSTVPTRGEGQSETPYAFVVSSSSGGVETPIYPGYALIRSSRKASQLAWTGSSCEGVPLIHPDQATRFAVGWVNDYSMTYEEAIAYFESLKLEVLWDAESRSSMLHMTGEMIPNNGADAVQDYICALTEHP